MNKERDKISIRRLISNVGYIMKFAMEVDRRAVVTIYVGYLVCSVTYAVYSTLFLKYFIQMMQDRRVDLVQAVLFVFAGIVILTVSDATEIALENWVEVRFLKVAGTVQRRFI